MKKLIDFLMTFVGMVIAVTAILLLSAWLSKAHAQAPSGNGWVRLNDSVSMNTRMFQRTTNRAGEPILVVVVQMIAADDGRRITNNYSVLLRSCSVGYGRLSVHDLVTGDIIPPHTLTFALGGSSVGDGIAEFLCANEVPETTPPWYYEQRRPQPGRLPQGQMERSNPRSGSWS